MAPLLWFELRMKLTAAAAGLVAIACWLAAPVNGGEPAEQLTAPQLMQRAHDGRAVWLDFPGFEARVKCSTNGAVANGTLRVTADGKVELAIPEDKEFAWVERTLGSVINHRLSDGEAITNVVFADEEADHPQGRLMRSLDPQEHSLWRAQGDVLTEVHRINDKQHMVISVSEVARTAEGKHLPRSYVVTTAELPGGRIKSVRQLYNEWTRLGNWDLPSRHLAVTLDGEGKRVAQQIELLDLQLLSNAKAAKTTAESK